MKRSVLSVIKWLWRAWFVLVFPPLLGIHLFLVNYFGTYASTINKFISLIFQIFGGLLILYSINSNIGIIKGKDFIEMVKSYIKGFPLLNRPTDVNVQSIAMETSVGKAKITLVECPETIEEKFEYLQKQIGELKNNLEEVEKELNEKIKRKSKEIRLEIKEVKKALNQIALKIEKVSIGGIKVQLFGVFLMIYGAISGYFA